MTILDSSGPSERFYALKWVFIGRGNEYRPFSYLEWGLKVFDHFKIAQKKTFVTYHGCHNQPISQEKNPQFWDPIFHKLGWW